METAALATVQFRCYDLKEPFYREHRNMAVKLISDQSITPTDAYALSFIRQAAPRERSALAKRLLKMQLSPKVQRLLKDQINSSGAKVAGELATSNAARLATAKAKIARPSRAKKTNR